MSLEGHALLISLRDRSSGNEPKCAEQGVRQRADARRGQNSAAPKWYEFALGSLYVDRCQQRTVDTRKYFVSSTVSGAMKLCMGKPTKSQNDWSTSAITVLYCRGSPAAPSRLMALVIWGRPHPGSDRMTCRGLSLVLYCDSWVASWWHGLLSTVIIVSTCPLLVLTRVLDVFTAHMWSICNTCTGPTHHA